MRGGGYPVKLVKSIINSKLNLAGFVVEVDDKNPFLNLNSSKNVAVVTARDLIARGFVNDQVDCSEGVIKEKGSFKINELPMLLYSEEKGYPELVEVENKIKLLARIIVNNRLAGFRVGLLGKELVLKYSDVIKLSMWFKPENFVVRYMGDKSYIAGKQGVTRLEDLPAEYFVNEGKQLKRVHGSAHGKAKVEVKPLTPPTKDLATLYNILREYGGVVLKLPDEEYKTIKKSTVKYGEEFTPLKVGEIGDPKIDFGEKNLNANTLFKKVGTVTVSIEGGESFPVYTYVWSRKSIFVNGQNYMPYFAIGIVSDGAARIRSEFGAELITREITDRKAIEPIKQLTGNPNLVFFEVDTSKLYIISKERSDKYIMTNQDILKYTETLTLSKVYRKYYNGLIKEIVEEAKKAGVNLDEGRPIFKLFEGMPKEYLEAIRNAGIDIYTGAYVKTVKVEPSEEAKTEDEETRKVVEIEYAIRGLHNITRLTYKDLKAIANGKEPPPGLSDKFVTMIRSIENISNLREKYELAISGRNKLEDIIVKCKRKLYLHKLAMYYAGDGRIHTHDREYWLEVPGRGKSATFNCLDTGCENLYVKVSGVLM